MDTERNVDLDELDMQREYLRMDYYENEELKRLEQEDLE